MPFHLSVCLLLASAGWPAGLVALQSTPVPVLSGKWMLAAISTLPPPAPSGATHLRIGSTAPDGSKLQEPKKIASVPPVYPPQARAARLGGQVILDATIDKQGYVTDLRVLRSLPGFDETALKTVAVAIRADAG